MAQTGAWLEPVLNGSPHWTKPPLTYLAIRIPYAFLGASTWAARVYLLPCHLAATFAVWWLALRVWRNRESARLCAMVYATSVIPMVASQTTSTDYPLTAALALAQACLWELFRARSAWAVYLLWFFMGIAFVTKGPPALLVLPALIMVWLRLQRAERRSTPLFAPVALILFLAVGFGWYAWEAWSHPGLLSYWLKDEVVNRSLSDKYNRHPGFIQNFVIYLPILLFGMLPWSLWLVIRWRAVWTRVRVPGGVGRVLTGLSDEALWLVWATVFPLGVFMLSRSKLPLYLLPLFVPFAVATGRLLQVAYGHDPRFRKGVMATACVACGLFIIGKAGMELVPSDRDMLQLYRSLTERGGVRDPSHLAVAGNKHLNGLSYYFDYQLALVPYDKLGEWAALGGERFILCSGKRQEGISQGLIGRAVEERVLSKRWQLLRIPAAAEASTKAP